jgi:hypothetical protein
MKEKETVVFPDLILPPLGQSALRAPRLVRYFARVRPGRPSDGRAAIRRSSAWHSRRQLLCNRCMRTAQC